MSDPIRSQFAKNMIRYRKQVGFSQEELSYVAGLHRTEIGQLETGQREPKISTLVKLAAALETTPNDLLVGIEWQTNPQAMLKGQYKIGD
jgi:transcriptional regulator with XRE-family HTH domain